jgi:hypothetical protein
LAKTNYNQAKRQKENARKARQQEKLAKKLARVAGEPEPGEPQPGVAETGSDPVGPANDVPVEPKAAP